MEERSIHDRSKFWFFTQDSHAGTWLFRKSDGDNWKIINYQAGDIVELKSVNLTVPIEQIYEDIIFE